MIMLPTTCLSCRAELLVNQKEYLDPLAHTCQGCYSQKIAVSKDEFIRAIELTHCNPDELDLDDFDLGDWILSEPKKKRCECGAEAAGAEFHSHWCPMWKPIFGTEKRRDEELE